MEQEVDVVDERHPLRFLVKFVVFAGLLYLAGRFLAQKKDEFADLTESQARDKLVEKMAPRVGDETAEDIADQVIPKLKDRGLQARVSHPDAWLCSAQDEGTTPANFPDAVSR
jgi:hypothetical protein